jgi:hypothetical protein
MKKTDKSNKQYSYITRESIAYSLVEKPNWLLHKDGQTFRDIDKRVKEQATAAKLSTPLVISRLVVHNNDDGKLDDKVRDGLYRDDLHQGYDYKKVGGGTEWTYTYVGDIYEELNISPSSINDIMNNKLFLELFSKRVQESKEKVILDLLGFTSNAVLTLHPWQNQVVKKMSESGKDMFLLSLPPRFGKTITVLEYTKKLVEDGKYSKDRLYLLPLSKNLSSNTSFVNDYNKWGYREYFNIIEDISLFKDEEKILERLHELLPKDVQIIIVTDEADLASHTTISTDKMKQIEQEFDVVKRITMTGTGIGKASKIFKGIPMKDICYIHMTYSELGNMMSDKYVKRNFLNVQYVLGEDELNWRQSFADPAKYESASEYIYKWTLDSIVTMRYELQDTEAVMVGINSETKKQLDNFAQYFGKKYSDECDILVLSGKYTTNGKAEKYTKTKLDTMRKNKDDRKLIVFTNGMGSRSFNESRIYRCVLCSDNEITSAKLQLGMRCCTPEDGKKIGDFIRIGFTPFEMDTQIIMLENETLDYSNNSKLAISMFLINNSFTNVVIDPSDNHEVERITNNSEDIVNLLDRSNKFNDTTSFWIPRLYDIGLLVDTEGIQRTKNKTRMVSTKGKKNSKPILPNKLGKLLKESEKKLRHYIDIGRSLPSIAFIEGYTNVNDFLNNGDWYNFLEIDKELFEQNYENETFKSFIDNGFIRCEAWTQDQHHERLIEYMRSIVS